MCNLFSRYRETGPWSQICATKSSLVFTILETKSAIGESCVGMGIYGLVLLARFNQIKKRLLGCTSFEFFLGFLAFVTPTRQQVLLLEEHEDRRVVASIEREAPGCNGSLLPRVVLDLEIEGT